MKHYWFVCLGRKCPRCIRQTAIFYERDTRTVIEQCYDCKRVWHDGITLSEPQRQKVEAWQHMVEGEPV